MSQSDALHRQIGVALRNKDFKRDAAGKSGEILKMAVATALSKSLITVDVISVGLALPEAHPCSPYEAVWRPRPGAEIETSYFDV